ncbi:MAG: DUF5060 domain-containing protein [Phycisphaerales bacterium]|nr:MAG: DUF5060 domain-containing protein [Phycisphaerales bacterium]
MGKVATMFEKALLSLVVIASSGPDCQAEARVALKALAPRVGRYEKLELVIEVEGTYENPFDPGQVDLTVHFKAPDGGRIILPAFFCQDYERRRLSGGRGRTNWFYPSGAGTWRARFAPMQTGTYSATARLKDARGIVESRAVRFECDPSQSRGFLRVGRKDPRFLEFSEGSGFFVIGQNLAFVGEGQYVTLSRAEEIFATLSANGANFLRIWTCCQDWAMAIEARKSAWDRSWGRNAPIVPMPGAEGVSAGRKCVKIEGADGASIAVSPSHAVALKPGTRYVVSGRFTADGPSGLRVDTGRGDRTPFDAARKGQCKEFSREFATGQRDLWLGRMTLSLVGSGTIWLDRLSLKEAAGGPELLWEAEVNRPVRGFYNQIDCFILDKLVEAAERNDIYLMLCVITRDLYMKFLSDDKSPEYQKAIDDVKKLMRYAVARWGYSTHVAAWEYFNEIDPGLPTDRFYAELGRYFEQTDIYRHLRTTSTWHPSAKDLRHPQLDIGQLHHYMRPGTKGDFKDEVAVVLDRKSFLREHAPNKPVLIGEFGLATPKWGLSEHMKQDAVGVHFRSSLWASAFSGASGTAMFWWWDQLDRQNAYHHYRPLAEFLKDVSFSGLADIRAKPSDARIRILGYQGPDRAFLWLSSAEATWHSIVVDKKQPPEIKDAEIEIAGLDPRRYRIRWWDTQKGGTVAERQMILKEGPLRVSAPPFAGDIACKITR